MMIRVFCCSDTHGRLPALPDRRRNRFVATLHAGDIYNGAELAAGDDIIQQIEGWTDPEVEEVGDWLARASPVYAVRGNHDLADPLGFFSRSSDLTGRVESVGSQVLIAGLGWHGERYYELPGESEMLAPVAAVRRYLRRLLSSRDCLVLLTHYPPKLPAAFPLRVPDVGWWHECTRELVEEYLPVLVVQGHIHELAGQVARIENEKGSTLLVSPGKRGMLVTIDINQRRAEVVETF